MVNTKLVNWVCDSVNPTHYIKSQLISKGNFGVFNSSGNELENFTGAEIFGWFVERHQNFLSRLTDLYQNLLLCQSIKL